MKKITNVTLCIIFVFTFLYGINVLVHTSAKEDKLLILGYHHIVPDKDKEQYFKTNMWVDTTSSFERQMKLLYDLGYHSVSLDDVYQWRMGNKELDEKSVVITFDDGFLSTVKFAQPILKKYGFQGSVFVIGSLINNHHGAYDPSKRQHVSMQDMQDTSTLSFYSHTYDMHHKKNDFKVNTLTKKQMIQDYEKQGKLVSNTYVAYPYGKYNDTIQQVLKEKGTRLAFGFHENRKADRKDDPYALPRFCVNAYTRLDVFKTMIESE